MNTPDFTVKGDYEIVVVFVCGKEGMLKKHSWSTSNTLLCFQSRELKHSSSATAKHNLQVHFFEVTYVKAGQLWAISVLKSVPTSQKNIITKGNHR